MLSDKEKKAIKEVKHFNQLTRYWQEEEYEEKEIAGYIGIILNLIEKQSKEIEELKQIKCKLDEKNIPIETLLAEFERLEDLEDDLTTVYLNGVYDGEKKVQDKIKAKIEFIKSLKEKLYYEENVISILQSLLEKE